MEDRESASAWCKRMGEQAKDGEEASHYQQLSEVWQKREGEE